MNYHDRYFEDLDLGKRHSGHDLNQLARHAGIPLLRAGEEPINFDGKEQINVD
jgi:hypothetical protein